jgi:hypothetical protein
VLYPIELLARFDHCIASGLEAVSQLLWPEKDGEVWFSLGENHEKAYRFPDFHHDRQGEMPATAVGGRYSSPRRSSCIA